MQKVLRRRNPDAVACRRGALHTGFHLHQIDHLAPLCYALDMPLLLQDLSVWERAKKYYPQIHTLFRSQADFSLSFLAHHFDLLFVSSKRAAQELSHLLEIGLRKKMCFFYVPHGNSDKGYQNKASDHFEMQENALIYGRQMEEMLKARGVRLKQAIITGNYRLQFYKKFQPFYDNIVQEEVLSKLDPLKKIVLYAPTWQDPEESSSAHVTSHLIDALPPDYNLIVKLHPLMQEQNPGLTYFLLEKYQSRPSIQVLLDFPLIYPILAKTDIYIGDFSSIGYDMLYFNKPLFFFNLKGKDPLHDKELYLHRCGMQLPHCLEEVFDFISTHLEENRMKFSSARQETYLFAYGKEKRFEDLLKEVLHSFTGGRTETVRSSSKLPEVNSASRA